MKKTIFIKGTAIAVTVASLALSASVFAQTPGDGQASRQMMRTSIRKEYKMIGTSTRPNIGMMGSTTRAELRDDRRASTTEARTEKGIERGGNMINQRIDSLNKLLGRIQVMKHISDVDRTALSASIQAEIVALNELKAKISTGTSTISIKSDVNSITKSYRIYALVEPQAQIIAAADRVLGIVDQLTIIKGKIDARLASSSQASSTDVTAVLTDFTSQIGLASTQAKAAISSVTGLKPDNGDTTIAAANKTALETARAQVVAAQKALQLAQKDIRTAISSVIPK
ncbi:MAG: hypothetical protein V4524_03960 [Patescibacteria group bacterium]